MEERQETEDNNTKQQEKTQNRKSLIELEMENYLKSELGGSGAPVEEVPDKVLAAKTDVIETDVAKTDVIETELLKDEDLNKGSSITILKDDTQAHFAEDKSNVNGVSMEQEKTVIPQIDVTKCNEMTDNVTTRQGLEIAVDKSVSVSISPPESTNFNEAVTVNGDVTAVETTNHIDPVPKIVENHKNEATPMSEDLKKLESRLEKYITKDANGEAVRIEEGAMTQSMNQEGCMSVSMRLHSGQTASSRAKADRDTNRVGTSQKTNGVTSPTEKSTGTASMLRSTLRKMTRFSIGKDKDAKKEPSDPNIKDQSRKSPPAADIDQKRSRSHLPNPTRLKKPSIPSSPNPSQVNRSKSFKEPERPGIYRQNSGGNGSSAQSRERNNVYSSSLRRTKNKNSASDSDQERGTGGGGGGHFARSGTGGALERGGNRRSASATRGGRVVKKSRPVQTSLTLDAASEDWREGQEHLPTTQIQFQVWLPELIGGDTENVETQVCDSNEPVDVRKNRQLTLDNMKLQREVERIKVNTTENEFLKKELKNVRAKLEEEQKTRNKIQADLDANHERVRLIMESMDSVERQFESREETVSHLEIDIRSAQDQAVLFQQNLNRADSTIAGQKHELDRSLAAQKMLLQQLQETEAEARELQDFLQAEKTTLGEALRDSEVEVRRLTEEMEQREVIVRQLEEQAGHLVRRSELRNQELQSARAELSGMKERAREMLLAQGAELSRACVAVSQLVNRLENVIGDRSNNDVVDMESADGDSDRSEGSESVSELVGVPESMADFNTKRRSSQFLVTPTEQILDIGSEFSKAMMTTSAGSDMFNKAMMTTSSGSDMFAKAMMATSTGSDSIFNSNGDLGKGSDSLTSLATAILDRKNSEAGANMASSVMNVPSLADQINQADALLVRYIAINTLNLNSKKNMEKSLEMSKPSVTNGNLNATVANIGKAASYSFDDVQTLDLTNPEISKKAVKAQNHVIEDLRCQLVQRESDLKEVRSKFTKNRQILTSNWEQAESEVKRLDDIYHDTVDQVLQALRSIPDVVSSTPTLNQLLLNLELAASEDLGTSSEIITSGEHLTSGDMLSRSQSALSHSAVSSLPALLTSSATQISLSAKEDMNANQSL